MKKLFLLSAAAIFVSSFSYAEIRRVGYAGQPRAGVDYANFNDAQTASSNGDTIQVYGNTVNGSVSKRLVIMGFGYNLDVNTGLQALTSDAPSGVSIGFIAGSDSSVIEGCSGSIGLGEYNGPDSIDNIAIKRCNASISIYNAPNNKIRNIKIYSSIVQNLNMVWNGINYGLVTNIQVYNSYVQNVTFFNSSTTAAIINCVCTSPEYSGGSLNLNEAGVLVKNSIFNSANITTNVNTVFENNFFFEAQPVQTVPGSNNRWNQRWNNLFERLGGTTDNPSYFGDPTFDEDYFILKAGSLAINGGFNALGQPTDCGMYGGEAAYRYKLSGILAVPAIYKLTAPSTAATANPYNVTISVRSNN